jgi:ABC-2 type transport system permease protein
VTALLSAELLRLRTVRSPRYIALGGLALIALTAGLNIDPGVMRDRGELADALGDIAMTGALLSAVVAASLVGEDFKRGSATMTYLSHPRRASVATARALTYAGLGLLFAGVAAVAVVAVGLARAHTGLSTGDIVQLIAGAAAGGAVLSAAGALVGTVARNATVASGAVVGWNLVENVLLRSAGVADYLPFGLLRSLMGMSDGIPAVAAIALLLAYLAVFAVGVRAWALPRDLT